MSRPTRQLAAIMFTDIVGYTKLMGEDEKKGMALVRKNKDVQKPLVEKHFGSWLKEMGDGTLISFPTASEAIHCALEIQQTLGDQTELKLRIGIHLGEIIVEEGDVYGDGVNMASRLQSIADPGGVYISDSVQKAIRSNKDIHYSPLGELELKNVDYPVKTYALRADFIPRPQETSEKHLTGRLVAEIRKRNVHRAGLTYLAFGFIVYSILQQFPFEPMVKNMVSGLLLFGLPVSIWLAWNFERSPEGFVRISSKEAWANPYSDAQKKPLTGNGIIIALLIIIVGLNLVPMYTGKSLQPAQETTDMSIAVLPFDNYSADVEANQHICDGVMVAVRNNLSRIQNLRVTPHTSVEQFRVKTASALEIGQILNVSYLLQGSVQRIVDQLKIDVALVKAGEDRVIWSETYEDDYSNLFNIQSQIANLVAKELQVIVSPEEQNLIDDVPTTNLEAWDLYLKGDALYTHMLINSTSEGYADAMRYFQQALELDPTLSKAYIGMAKTYQLEKFFQEFLSSNFLDSVRHWCEMALNVNLQEHEAYALLGNYYMRTNKQNLGLAQYENALDLNPNDSYVRFEYGVNMVFRTNKITDGFERMYESITSDPESIWISSWYNQLAWAYVNIGYHERARPLFEEALQLSKNYTDSIDAYGGLAHSYLMTGESEEALYYAKEWEKIDQFASREIGEILCILMNDCEAGEKEYEEAYALFPERFNQRQRMAMAKMLNGKPEGREMMKEELQKWELAYRLGRSHIYDVAGMYAMLGNKEKAYEYLDKLNETDGWRVGLHDYSDIDPFFTSLRDEPRFQNIVSEAKASMDSIRSEVDKLGDGKELMERVGM